MPKTYLKTQKLQYHKRKILPKRSLHRKATKGSGFGKVGSTSTKTHVAANIMDITHFLTRYLSGKQNVMVTPEPQSYAGFSVNQADVAGKRFFSVNVPQWNTYDLPVHGFDKYRIYREGVWHESCHIRYTPEQVFTYKGSGTKLERDVMNIIEDRRIEDLGVEEWKGYIPERLYTQAYAYALRPDVSKLYKAHLPPDASQNQQARFEAFLQRLLIGRVKGTLPDSEMEKVEKTARKVEEELKKLKGEKSSYRIFGRLAGLTDYVIKNLNLEGITPERLQSEGDSWTDTFTEEYARQNPKTDVKKGMNKFFKEVKKKAKHKKRDDEKKIPADEITEEDVEKAKSGTAQVQAEYRNIHKQQSVDPTIAGWQPIAAQVPPETFRDQKFITQMNTHLRHWKTGYKEKIGESGARLSIPDYVRHKETPFATRLKQSVKGKKILFVTDFSGSMMSKEEDYKRALISSMEVLDGIGCNVAVFGFGGDPALGTVFFRVKGFERRKWTGRDSAKLAAVTADYPCTPTSRAYKALEAYIKKQRPHVTVTVTDGEPDKPDATKREVNELKKHTRMVAFGISDSRHEKWMERQLKSFGYNRSFAVDDVYKIPRKLVKIITGE